MTTSSLCAAVRKMRTGLYEADLGSGLFKKRIARVGPLKPGEIKHIRENARVSQAVFAALLNTSVSTVKKWEIGQKKPIGTALKLLHLVQERGLDAVA